MDLRGTDVCRDTNHATLTVAFLWRAHDWIQTGAPEPETTKQARSLKTACAGRLNLFLR